MRARIWFLTLGWVLACAASGQADPANPDSPRLALLIGCTKYPECKSIRPLHGPANDLPLFRTMLRERFGFEESEITTLLAWPDDEALRPTRKNIVHAFESLIAEARPGSQIVILLSGHGTQLPVGNGDSQGGDRFEDDGLDEVFLPADVQPWNGEAVPNAIVDNEIERWLSALADKGAHVWVTFDTCHSGTMTRSLDSDEPLERSRMVQPEDLAVPAVTRSGDDIKPVRPSGGSSDGAAPRSLTSPRPSGGTITAFSAAQAFEEAPELPRPSNAPRKPAHYYGLFTYSMVKAVQRQKGPVSYRDLAQSILNAYCAERGTRGPTPLFEGELDRQIMGMTHRDAHALLAVRFHEGQYRIAGGELSGVTVGSLLVVQDSSDAKAAPLGHLKVIEATPVDAVAEPCDPDGAPSTKAISLQEGSRCRIVVHDLGKMQVPLAIRRDPGLPARYETALMQAIDRWPPEIARLATVESDPESADWIVALLTPEVAARDYHVRGSQPVLILTPRGTRQAGPASSPTADDEPAGVSAGHRVRFVLPLPSSEAVPEWEEVARLLAASLQKVFTWRNVWRVADSVAGDAGPGDLVLKLKVRREGKELESPPVLYAGERVEVQLLNEGTRDWWVSLLFLGSDLSISRWTSGSVKASSQLRTLRATVSGTTQGAEGFVVFASPISVQRMEPQFDFLEQPGLADPEAGRSVTRSANSPFGNLLEGARTGRGTRSLQLETPDQPSVLLKSWITRTARLQRP